ncbi:MAG: mobile mystery protein B [Kineosporiaceae bacterium]|nr:mobile mystery protein B [Kineosporiaceae bacterium]
MTDSSLFGAVPGATPLTEQERDGLLLPVLTRGELDAVEAENIARARLAALSGRRRLTAERILDVGWMKQLHRAMYGDVWAWAGSFRTTERNIGVEPWRILLCLHDLIADAAFWLADVRVAGQTALSADEFCLRLSHRAVLVHPFPNGNGRWSRLLADAAAHSLGRPPFGWGRAPAQPIDPDPQRRAEVRRAYLAALRTADLLLDYAPLMAFARS